MAKVKKKGNPIILGMILLGGALAGLWKNEHRFDYHKAAAQTTATLSPKSLTMGGLFSYTGEMEQQLHLEGYYVKGFTGYLKVERKAEIYAWDKDEDDDGVSWSMRWMSYVQDNERNRALTQRLKSAEILPPLYKIDELNVLSDQIQFVDKLVEIFPSTLILSEVGQENSLTEYESFYYLFKGGQPKKYDLGDERLSYRALPVPHTASYFGRWDGESAVFHQAVKREGIISGMIQDKGILHHLVSGDREVAISTMKSHFERLKTLTRVIGLVVASIGGGVFFSGLTRFLIYIPVFGVHLTKVTGWIGLGIGFVLGLVIIATAFVTSKPYILIPVLVVLGGLLAYVWSNYRKKKARIHNELKKDVGHTPETQELVELEFIKLWQLLASDGMISDEEEVHLQAWIKRHRLKDEKVEELTQKALTQLENSTHADPSQNLEGFVRYALADGHLDKREMKTLEQAAAFNGFTQQDLRALILRV